MIRSLIVQLMIPPGRLERWHRNAGIGAGAGSAKELELEALHEGDEGEVRECDELHFAHVMMRVA